MFAKTFKRGLLPSVVAVLLVLATFCEVPVYTDDYEPWSHHRSQYPS